jgi:hypothetical protein
MAFTDGDVTEIAIRGVWLGQAWYNVWQYELNLPAEGMTAADLGEAWWNHVKGTYRAIAINNQTGVFQSVLVKSLESLVGDAGEFPIPIGEGAGTRTPPTDLTIQPSFLAAGVRLSVGTRLTRPGQKRFAFLTEEDSAQNALGSAFNGLVNTHMNLMSAPMILGVPALLTELLPVVVRKDATGVAVLHQDITGFVINPNVTSQVSRKIGRGI